MAQAVDLDSVANAAADPVIKKFALTYALSLGGAITMTFLAVCSFAIIGLNGFQHRHRRDFLIRGAFSAFLTAAPHAFFLWAALQGGGDWFNGTELTEMWWLVVFAISTFFVAENMASKVGHQSDVDEFTKTNNPHANPLGGTWKGFPMLSLTHAFLTAAFFVACALGKWLDTSVVNFGVAACVLVVFWLITLILLWLEVATWRDATTRNPRAHKKFGSLHAFYTIYLVLILMIIVVWILGPAVASIGAYADIAIGYLILAIAFSLLQIASVLLINVEYKDGKPVVEHFAKQNANHAPFFQQQRQKGY